MSRFLLLFAVSFSVGVWAQNVDLDDQVTIEPEFTELEYRIVELSGLVSLSDQAKGSAQHMIALSTVESTDSVDSETDENVLVPINHAQHFGIAQSLSKFWNQVEWERYLLAIVGSIDAENQEILERDLSQAILRSAQEKEKVAISNQNKTEYSAYIHKLNQQPPAEVRWKLVEALDQQSLFSQLIIKTREQVYKEIASQVKGWQAPENWEQETRQEVLEFLFYAYRKTPNSELNQIANSYNTPALKSFLVKVKAGI